MAGIPKDKESIERDEATQAASRCNSDSDSESRCSFIQSVRSNSSVGYRQTKHNLISVLMHPISLPLLIYLNNMKKQDEHPEYIWSALTRFILDDPTNMRENVFAVTTLDRNNGETDFNAKLLFHINDYEIGKSLFITAGQTQISSVLKETGRAETGKVDFIFHTNESDDNNKSSVVALLNVGMNHELWWKKQDRILKYVKLLRRTNGTHYKIDQPLLISVITFNEEAKNESNDDTFGKQRATDLNDDGTFTARFGVFLCIPKNKNEFRIALLWRHETTTLQDASIQFGRILYAIQLCSYLRESSDLDKKKISYTYLGPNCCKIGKSVRLILTHRISFAAQ